MNTNAFTTKYACLVNKLLTNAKLRATLADDFIEINALWDTGAQCSCISESIARRMNLLPTGMKTIKTPSGESIQSTYCVDLYLPNNVAIMCLPVCDSKISSQFFDILIGMDVISKGDFSISNFNSKTYFSFRIPSIKHSDFVQELRVERLIGGHHGKRK